MKTGIPLTRASVWAWLLTMVVAMLPPSGSCAQATQPATQPAVAAPATQPAPASGSLHEKILGRWKFASMMDGGRVAPAEVIANRWVTFDATTMRLHTAAGGGEQMGYTLDEGGSPAYIDLWQLNRPERVYQGLIELRDGKLHLVSPEGNNDQRSTAFESVGGNSPNDIYMVLEREEAKREE